MSAIATGSFCRNRSYQYLSSRPFSPVSHAIALLLDPLLPGPLQRRGLVHARAARALGRAGWIAGCSRQGFLDPERETSLDDVLTPLELPTRRFQAELGTGRAAEVIDLSVNGVRVTLMPHDLGELSGAAVDAARRAGSSTPHPAGGSTCYEESRVRGQYLLQVGFIAHRAAQPPRFARWCTPKRSATSRNRARLAAKKRPSNRPAASFRNRACQFSALLPSRSKITASSPEITALPSRNNRPVCSTRSR